MADDKNPKRLKTGEGTIEISTSADPLNEKEWRPFHRNGFIHLQEEDSIKCKLEKGLLVGDSVMLIKDYPDSLLFKGYVCMVIFEVSTVTEPFY